MSDMTPAAQARARYLTYAGGVPFVALALGRVTGLPAGEAWQLWLLNALLGYGAVIASFMAGTLWGIRLGDEKAEDGLGADPLIVSNCLALAAWGALLIANEALSLILLALVFTGLYAVDARLVTQRVLATWYARLRARITAVVVVALVAAALIA